MLRRTRRSLRVAFWRLLGRACHWAGRTLTHAGYGCGARLVGPYRRWVPAGRR